MPPLTSEPSAPLRNPHRLSILVHGNARRARIERCVESLLDQAADPISTEVVVASPSADPDLSLYLRTAFAEAFHTGRLKVVLPRESAAGALEGWRLAAGAAEGAFLALVDPRDRWRRDALRRLEPHLYGNDLILGSDDPEITGANPTAASTVAGTTTVIAAPADRDWLGLFLQRNRAIPSSGILRRTLWDELQPEHEDATRSLLSQAGLLLRTARSSEYALWLAALEKLSREGRKARLQILVGPWVPVEPRPASGSAEDDPLASALPLPIREFEQRLDRLRETLSALRFGRKLPPRYWPAIGRRILGRKD